MIDLCAQSLYDLVQAIPAIANATGLAVGGKAPDPGMTKMTLPFAWVLAHAGVNTANPQLALPPTNIQAALTYVVMLYVPYLKQSDLITNQLPLLNQVIRAVHGKLSPTGNRWQWKMYRLGLVNPDRLGYSLEFFTETAAL
jgi:hypothetical protein